jgi:RES domain-containing protein
MSPRWAHAPTSGAGAARNGGRLNRPGIEALYLSVDTATALAEYQRNDPLLPPGTLAAFLVTLGTVVDFRAGYASGTWEALWQEIHCDWKAQWLLDGIAPPSWDIGDRVRECGIAGIYYPSARRPGGINLVIYPDLLGSGDGVEVYDPQRRLPEAPGGGTSLSIPRGS